VTATLLEHCKLSSELCQSGILTASPLALEYTKAALYDDFCELGMDYTKHLADLDMHYCSLLHADLETIAASIPLQHQQLIKTVSRLVDFYKLRVDSSSTHDKCNLPATSRTLELLDHSGVQLWNQKSNKFSIDWKQAFFDTESGSDEKLVTDMSFDRYAWLQIRDSLFSDFQSDMCRLASDPVVHGFIEEARLVFQNETLSLKTASDVAR
jgi:hypothetical protein